MKLNKMLNKIMNVFLCFLMLATILTVNTKKISAEDDASLQEETSEVDNNPTVENTNQEEDNNIVENVDVNDEQKEDADVNNEETSEIVEEQKDEEIEEVPVLQAMPKMAMLGSPSPSATDTIYWNLIQTDSINLMNKTNVDANWASDPETEEYEWDDGCWEERETGYSIYTLYYEDNNSLKFYVYDENDKEYAYYYAYSCDDVEDNGYAISTYGQTYGNDLWYVTEIESCDGTLAKYSGNDYSKYPIFSFEYTEGVEYEGGGTGAYTPIYFPLLSTYKLQIKSEAIDGADQSIYAPFSSNLIPGWENESNINACYRIEEIEILDEICPNSLNSWFANMTCLKSIDLSNLNTSNATDMSHMFERSQLTSLNLSNLDTSNVTDMNSMFANCNSLTSINLSNLDTSNVTDMNSMFANCNSLTSINLSNLDTSNVTNMEKMFDNCNRLVTLDLSNFNTSKVTNMSNMFNYCWRLKTINISSFNTSNVTDMNSMFCFLLDLESLKFPVEFDTSKVTSMSYMFYYDRSLISLSLPLSFNTSNVTDMSYMFCNCTGLSSLTFSKNFITTNVTDMCYMFKSLETIEKLDLHTFNISNVTNTNCMFYECKNLKTIIANSNIWNPSNITNSYGMFAYSTKLVGGNGWKYVNNYSKNDKTYAYVDCNESLGYLTEYVESKYNIAFDANGGTGSMNSIAVIIGEGTYLPLVNNQITNSGYTFAGWATSANGEVEYSDGDCVVDNLASANGTATLYAKWEENPSSYTIDFDANNGTGTMNPQILLIDETKELKTNTFTRQGYKFVGWNTQSNGEGTSYEDKASVSNLAAKDGTITLYAQWESDVSKIYWKLSAGSTIDLNSATYLGCCEDYNEDYEEIYDEDDGYLIDTIYYYYYYPVRDDDGAIEIYVKKDNIEYTLTCLPCSGNEYSYSCSGDAANYYVIEISTSEGSIYSCSGSDYEGCAIINFTYVEAWDYEDDNAGVGTYTRVTDFPMISNYELQISNIPIGDEGCEWFYSDQTPGWQTLYGAEPENNQLAKISDISILNEIQPLSLKSWFKCFSNIESIDLSNINSSLVEDMSSMFNGCKTLTTINLSSLSTGNVTNMSSMFEGCSALASVVLSGIDTSNVEDMSSMFNGCKTLTTINLSSLSTGNVTNMSSMFEGCSALATLDLSDFVTSEVTNMSSMFKMCKELSSLDVSKFNTLKVENMNNMFNECSKLTTLNLSSFNTPNVTDMSYMFNNCILLAQLDICNIDTSKVVNMSFMFNCDESLTTLTMPYLNTENVTNMNHMFYQCKALKSLDLSNWNVSKVTSMLNIFKECSELESLNLSNWKANNVSDMSEMFRNCLKLKTLNLKGFTTEKVKNMYKMFASCKSLLELDVSGFNTANVTNMQQTFIGCNKLVELDLSNFNTSKVTSIEGMFDGCSSIKILDLSSFDTSSIVSVYTDDGYNGMQGVFYGCSALQDVDISSFDTSKIKSISSMFLGCNNLKVLDLSSFSNDSLVFNGMSKTFRRCSSLETVYIDSTIWKTSKATTYQNSSGTFNSCIKIVGGQNTSFNSYKDGGLYARLDGGTSQPGYFTEKPDMYKIKFNANGASGIMIPVYVNSGEAYTLPTNIYVKEGSNFKGWSTSANGVVEYEDGESIIDLAEADKSITLYAKWEEYYWSLSNDDSTLNISSSPIEGVDLTDYAPFAPNAIPSWYSDTKVDKTKITSINIMNEIAPTSLSYWFAGFTNLDLNTINLTNLNTTNVSDMSHMFDYARGLKSLDLSNFDTSNVTNMSHMFDFCNNLTTLDLSSFDTINVTDMSGMFASCTSLSTVNLSSFNTSNVTDMSYMFNGVSAIKSIDLSDFDTSKVTDMSHMFSKMNLIKTLDISSFNTTLVTDMTSMFEDMYSLETIIVDEDKWSTSSIETGKDANMFKNDKYLKGQNNTSYNASIIDKTYAVVDKEGQVGYLSLQAAPSANNIYWAATDSNKLYISNESLQEITDETVKESGYFKGSDSLPGWYNYAGKSTITEVIVQVQIAPTNMASWFENFKSLTILTNFTNINTDNVTDMSNLYKICEALSLAYTSFNTINVIDMSHMFEDCKALTTLDLSSFNTSKVTDMSNMFKGLTLSSLDLTSFNTYNLKKTPYMFDSCINLTTITVSDTWGVESVIDSTSMFNGDTNLKGMNNTPYDTQHIDKEYARVDEGEDNPGYLSKNVVSYTINFDKNGGTGSMDPVNASVGVELKLPENTFTRNNYEFIGWNTKADGSGTNYLDKELVVDLTTTPNGSVTLYAKWKQADKIYWATTATNGTLYIASRAITSSDLQAGESINGSGSFTNNTVLGSNDGWRTTLGYTKVVFIDKIKPKNTSKWFLGFNNLSQIDNINYLNTSSVSDMSNMFSGCASLLSLDVTNFDTSKVTNVSNMFNNCSTLASLNVSNFDTAKVTNMSYMFSGCTSLSSLDASNFVTSKVTDMSYMFEGCSNLTSLNVSGFDTSKVTDVSSMFEGCSNLTSLDLTNFDVSKVQSLNSTFKNCSNLTILNLANFNTVAVTDMSSMFEGCSELTTIKVIEGKWSTTSVTSSSNMFAGCAKLKGGNKTACDGINNVDKTYAVVDKVNQPGYLTEIASYTIVYHDNKGTSSEQAIIDKVAIDTNYKLLANSFTPVDDDHVFAGWNTEDDGTGTFYADKATVYNLTTPGATIDLYAQWKNDPKIYWNVKVKGIFAKERILNISNSELTGLLSGSFRSSETPTWLAAEILLANKVTFKDKISPASTAGWFEDFSFLTTIENITNLDTSNDSDMSYMFKNCKRLTTLDLSSFDTSKVTNMSNMFNDCESLRLINLSGFNTSNVTNMSKMFSYCDELVTIIVSDDWDLSKVTTSDKMFKEDYNLIGGNGTPYDSTNPDNMSYAVMDKDGQTGYFTKNDFLPIYWELIGSNNSKLVISSDINKISNTDDYKPFSPAQTPNWTSENLTKVTTIEFLDSVTTYQVQGWFNSVTNVKTITHLDYLNTSKVFDMSNMFAGCSKLSELDLSNFNTAKVTDMSNMFNGCSLLTTIDLSSFDTSNVTNMSGMFSNCNNLSAINYPEAKDDFKGFDTSKVTDMSYMFNKCYGLKSINLSSYDTSNVTNMANMFNSCTSLKLIDLSDQSSEILSKFVVTAKVTNMSGMFYNCSSLKTIVVSSAWILNEEATSSDMFTGCISIVGEQGQTYDSSYTDKTYARVDNLTDRGYLSSTYNRFKINTTEYSNLTAALADCKDVNASYTIVMINDSNESLTNFNIYGKITIDLNGNNLIVKGINFVNPDASIVDSANDKQKGSLTYTIPSGFIYTKTLSKTSSDDPTIRYLPVSIGNQKYQFNDTTVGYVNKTRSSEYWQEGDQAMVGSFIRNDNDINTILSTNGGVSLGVIVKVKDQENALPTFMFSQNTIQYYKQNYTHAKPYFHLRGLEGDSITINGYIAQINGGINYSITGVPHDVTLVKDE